MIFQTTTQQSATSSNNSSTARKSATSNNSTAQYPPAMEVPSRVKRSLNSTLVAFCVHLTIISRISRASRQPPSRPCSASASAPCPSANQRAAVTRASTKKAGRLKSPGGMFSQTSALHRIHENSDRTAHIFGLGETLDNYVGLHTK